MLPYAALWCKSNASFLGAASHPEELVDKAAELGLGALALTDADGVYGMLRAHVRATELGIPLIAGSEVTLEDGTRIVLLATSRDGWRSLCRLLASRLDPHPVTEAPALHLRRRERSVRPWSILLRCSRNS